MNGWGRDLSAAAPVMGAVLLSLVALVGVLHWYQVRRHPHPEVVRKLVHVGMGLVILPFPWLFPSPWPVVTLALVSVGAMLGLRALPALRHGPGSVLHAVQRQSLGEICYPIAVAIVFVLKRDQALLFVIPVLILALADAVAALIGITYGRLHYSSTDGVKTAEGSLAFFTVAFLSVHVPLLLLTDVGRAQTLLIALVLGLLAMIVEAVAWNGLDNLFVPLLGYALLQRFWTLSAEALLGRLVMVLGLMGFLLLWRRHSRLSDSGLLGAALFGYAAWALGNLGWLLPPLVFFVGYGLLWPLERDRHGDKDLFVVAAVVAPGFVWLMVALENGGAAYGPMFLDPGSAAGGHPVAAVAWLAYAVVFASHLAAGGVSWLRSAMPTGRLAGLSLAWGVGGWALVYAPPVGLAWMLGPRSGIPATGAPLGLLLGVGLAGTLVGALVSFVLMHRVRTVDAPKEPLHWLAALGASVASLVPWLVLRG